VLGDSKVSEPIEPDKEAEVGIHSDESVTAAIFRPAVGRLPSCSSHTHTMHFLLLHFPVKLSSRRRSTIGERFLVRIFFDGQIPNNLNQLNLRKKPK
jgi:hypothetical protein